MKMTMDVLDIKNTTQEIAMLGQYGLNVGSFVEEAKVRSQEVAEGAKVRLRLIRNAKGNISVILKGIDSSYLIRSEMDMEENCIEGKSIYNIARFMCGEEILDKELERKCKSIYGTIASMGVEVLNME